MIIKTTPGKTYVVESDNGCTVKRPEASTAALTVGAGAQGYFVATAQEYEVSDDTARVVQVFNAAPMAASGGGGSGTGASITIDQTYSSTSSNAQSGVAVAEALNTLNCKATGTYVSIGTSSVNGKSYATNVGHNSTANGVAATALGYNAHARQANSIAIGSNCSAEKTNTAAIGINSINKDSGTVLLTANIPSGSETYQAYLYLIAANSTLANTYEEGAACLGYVVKTAKGNILECGTRKLSELLTNNTAFAPAAFGLDDEPTPGPFLPTGIMEPMEMDEITSEE